MNQNNDLAYRVPFDLDPEARVPETNAISSCGAKHGYVLLATHVSLYRPRGSIWLGTMTKASEDVLGDAFLQLGQDELSEPIPSFDLLIPSDRAENNGLFITRFESYSRSSGYIEAFLHRFYPIKHQCLVRLRKVVVRTNLC